MTSRTTEAESSRSLSSCYKKSLVQKKLIVGLKSRNGQGMIPVDYYLTQHDLPLNRLPNELELMPYFMSISKKQKEFLKSILTETCKVSEKDFEFLKVIGRGGYSKVVCARKKDSGRLYAIKIMNKSDIEKKIISERIVLNERDIQMLFADNPFFLNLHWTFEDSEHYYLVTDL
jgi:hypothetical protein